MQVRQSRICSLCSDRASSRRVVQRTAIFKQKGNVWCASVVGQLVRWLFQLRLLLCCCSMRWRFELERGALQRITTPQCVAHCETAQTSVVKFGIGDDSRALNTSTTETKQLNDTRGICIV